MTSLRKLAVSLTALGCVGLLGCSSGGDTPAARALPPAGASASPSTDPSAAPTTTGAPAPVPAPGVSTAPSGVPPAPGQAPGQAPNGAPGQPNAAPKPPAVQPNPANPGAAPPAAAGDPAQALAAAGPQGKTYLKLLHDRGIVPNAALDGIYVLFGQAVCSAKARGTARPDILTQLSQIGPMLAPGTTLPPGQISEVFVSSAEQSLC